MNKSVDIKRWLKAVWLERQKEVEGILPSNWLIGNHIYWPPVANATNLFKERADPDIDRWSRFQLIQIKHSSDSLEDYGERTSTENPSQYSNDCIQYDNVFKKFGLGDNSGNEQVMPQSKESQDVNREIPPEMSLPPITSFSNNSSKPGEGSEESSRLKSREYSPNHQSRGKYGYRERSPCCHHSTHERSPYSHSRSGYKSPRSRSRDRSPHSHRHSNYRSQRSGNRSPCSRYRSYHESHGRSPSSNKKYYEKSSISHRHSRAERSMERERSVSSMSNSSDIQSNPLPFPLKVERISSSSSAFMEQLAVFQVDQSMENEPVDSFPMSEEMFQKRVIGCLTDIKRLLTKNFTTSSPSLEDSSAGGLYFSFTPLSTMEELDQFNIMVLDPSVHRDLLSKFSRLGGGKMKNVVMNIMNKLLSNTLMCQMNMKGLRGEKIGFAEMPACTFIIDCVLKVIPKATVTDVLDVISRRLKYAPKRK